MAVVLNNLKALGSAYFRIDWIGDVVPRSVKAARTPSVRIVVSPRHAISDVEHDPNAPAIVTIVPLAYLRLLRVGDIWQYGSRVKEGEGEEVCFSNIDISRSTVDVRPVGLPVSLHNAAQDAAQYLLPFDQFSAHRHHTGSYGARIRVDDDTYILVPCMELIRFYFGASGSLLTRIFSGPLEGTDLYESANLNPRSGAAHVKLAKGIPGVAAATVGRIALNWHAANAVKRIISSGVSSAANGESYYPATTFPFIGITTLVASGCWIRSAASNVFMVDRLKSCAHPFPFRSMFYEMHPSHNKSSQAEGLSLARAKPRKKTEEHSDKSERDELGEGPVKTSLSMKSVQLLDDAAAFPDLQGKPIRRITVSESAASIVVVSPSNPLAVGPKEMQGASRQVDISTECDIVKPMSGALAIMQAIEILQEENENIVMKLCTLPGASRVAGFPFTPIRYLKRSEQENHPVILGACLHFHIAKRYGKLIFLTYEISNKGPHTAFISVNRKILWNSYDLRTIVRSLANPEVATQTRAFSLDAIFSAHEAHNSVILKRKILLAIRG